MKRNNSQSESRKLKRGHLRFVISKFITNEDGTPKIFKQRKTNKGRWVNV